MKNKLLGVSIATMAMLSPFAHAVDILIPNDNKQSTYAVNLVSHVGNTWTYSVAQVKGRTLSHWVLGINNCLNNVVSSSPKADEIGVDPSTAARFVGIKWNSAGGTFSFTLDKDYESTTLQALVKTSTVYNTGNIEGPDCSKPVGATAPVTTEPTPPATTEPTPPATTEPTPPVTTEPTTASGPSDSCAAKSKTPKSTNASWVDSKGTNAYDIELVSVSGRTWTYRVTKTSGKALSHWTLGIPACMSKIVSSTSTDGSAAEIGKDASIKDINFSGIKWNSEGGVFSFTLDNDYATTAVDVLAKAGSLQDGGYSTSTIMGPDCSALATTCADKPLSGEQDVVAVHVWKRVTATPISPEAYQALDKNGVESGVYAIEKIDASGKTVDIEVEVVK